MQSVNIPPMLWDCQNKMKRPESTKRTNEQWLSELRGRPNHEAQCSAITDLVSYMFVVAFNALEKRRDRYSKLNSMDSDALKELAQDFAQEIMVKLASNKFRLLKQYENKANFTSWVAMIVNNEIASEFRKVRWQRVQPITEFMEATFVDSHSLSPEDMAINNCLGEALNQALDTLSPNLRTALIRCVLYDERAATVGADLGMTANAVYSLVHRAKRTLRTELLDYQLS